MKQQNAMFSSTTNTGRRRDTKFRTYKHVFFGRELTLQGYEKQALNYLVHELKIAPSDILCECETDFKAVLNLRYKYAGEWRHYIPDIYIKSKRTVVEVKSVHTLGLLHKKKRGWSMTCAKARAVKEHGYSIILLLLDDSGRRIKMPKGWYDMKKEQVVKALGADLRTGPTSTLF